MPSNSSVAVSLELHNPVSQRRPKRRPKVLPNHTSVVLVIIGLDVDFVVASALDGGAGCLDTLAGGGGHD